MFSLVQEKRLLLRMIYPEDDGWPFWRAKGVDTKYVDRTDMMIPWGAGSKGRCSTVRGKLIELRSD